MHSLTLILLLVASLNGEASWAYEETTVSDGGTVIGTVTLEADDAKKTGAVIETVTPDSPADRAGMKAGDAIVEFDGERVRRDETQHDDSQPLPLFH